jgi:D-alanyl-D-alanine-carboxypeptidase/D-alanyl-D-alanine-endopeptidase
MGELEGRVGEVVARHRTRHAGLVIGVQARGETAFWHRGRVPGGADTIFEIGSITKTFTATLLADMAREGIVALDDPIQRHLPDGVRLPVRGRDITLEDLASHRSGLPRLPKGMLRLALTRERRDPYARIDAERLAAAAGATRPRRPPGGRSPTRTTAWACSDTCSLCGRARPTSGSCARICEPLGLDDTWVEPPEPKRARIAPGHTRRGRETPPWRFDALAGAGGLRSTAADLLAFLRLHAAPSASPLAAAAAETARPRARWGRVEIGLAWLIVPPGGRVPRGRTRSRLLFHEGGTGGFRSFAGVAPEAGVCAVVLASQARGVGRLGLRVLGVLMEAPF